MGYRDEIDDWHSDRLIGEEVRLRRAIVSYATKITLSAGSAAMSGGATAPIAAPVAGYNTYKLLKNKRRLKAVRAVLHSRSLSPTQKKKRDVMIPVAKATLRYLATLGLTHGFELSDLGSGAEEFTYTSEQGTPYDGEYYDPDPNDDEYYDHGDDEYYDPEDDECYDPDDDEYYDPEDDEYYDPEDDEYYDPGPDDDEYYDPGPNDDEYLNDDEYY